MTTSEDAEEKGRPSTTRRGRGLSVGRIAAAALALMDEEGVGAASMRAIGARLGVEAMSLYKHVATRDALLDAVVERIVAELNNDPEVKQTPDQGWRDYLARLARGVRRYARAHPHAFPLVTTRPAVAPWVNPPLRSLPWIESLLSALLSEGFTDEQALFAYRSFNSFLLGYLLMETGAMTVHDPQSGDGSFSAGNGTDPDPVPGGLTPTRSEEQQANLENAETKVEVLNPQDDIDLDRFPIIHRLARGLAEDHFSDEFESAMQDMLDRIAQKLG